MNQMIYLKTFVFFLLMWTAGCSPGSLKDLRIEAEEEIRRFVKDLQGVETLQDLQKSSKKIQKRFVRLAVLLVETRKYPDEGKEPLASSEALFIELARIYEIPGAKECVEGMQMEAIRKIDRSSVRRGA